MNHKQILILFLFLFTLALALIPLASAQIDIQGGAQTVMDTLGGYFNQASTFVSEQPVATGVIGVTGAGTGIGAVGWKLASKAKNALQGKVHELTNQKTIIEQQAATIKEQLSSFQTEAQTKLSEANTQIEALTKQASDAQTAAAAQAEELKRKALEMETLSKQASANFTNQLPDNSVLIDKTTGNIINTVTKKIVI